MKLAHIVLQAGRLRVMRDRYLTVLNANVAFDSDFPNVPELLLT